MDSVVGGMFSGYAFPDGRDVSKNGLFNVISGESANHLIGDAIIWFPMSYVL